MDSDTTRISIVLPTKMLEVIKRQARREKRSYSSLIREAIEERFGVEDTVMLGGPRKEDEPGQLVPVPVR